MTTHTYINPYHQKAKTKIFHMIRQATIVFRPVPSINPRNDPKAAFNADAVSFLAHSNSAMNAPRNEPAIIPIGVNIIPAIRPINAPLSAYLLPPVAFVRYIGTI